MFEQLAKTLDHLGEKQVAVVDIWGLQIRFDWTMLIMSWIAMGILFLLAFFLRRALCQPIEEKPNRAQAALDALIAAVEGQLTSNFSSPGLGARMFPFIGTLFLYVLVCNWLSVLPGLESPTANPNVTIGLALLVFILAHAYAIRIKGVRRYLRGFLDPYPFMLPLNLIGEIAKPISHSFRLFGNVFAGTVLVTVVTAVLVPIAVPAALNAVFGLFSGFIQAFVFSVLAVTYINMAVEG
ncbi:MAG: F0F1 ATP synthase subunit A [Candidatus Bipolaricaulota bacterium]